MSVFMVTYRGKQLIHSERFSKKRLLGDIENLTLSGIAENKQ